MIQEILNCIDKEIKDREGMCFFSSVDRKTLDDIANNRGEIKGLELAKQIIQYVTNGDNSINNTTR